MENKCLNSDKAELELLICIPQYVPGYWMCWCIDEGEVVVIEHL
jgi:hypothetical protein